MEKSKEISERLPLVDVVKLGNYEIVEGRDLSTITRNDADKNVKLDGLLLYGYETKFADQTNENGERYTRDCLDKFIERYYVGRRLNMPLTILHRNDLLHLAGRVLVLEVNTVGFYFVCYVPKTYKYYEEVCALVKEGILQGLSKEGWSTKGKCYFTKDGDFDYYEVQEMEMLAVSLVATPANGNPLERIAEVKNALTYKNTINAKNEDAFAAMFN